VRCLPFTLLQDAAGTVRDALADRHEAAVLRSPTPFDSAARWAGEEQNWQYHQRRGGEREEKCPDEPHAAVDAAKSCENAESYIDDCFEHGARSRRSPAVALSWMEPLPDWLASAGACQELAAVAPVLALSELDEERFERESHNSFWDFTNSR
jgi:hypothetical protein